ncbi:aldose 1-epimerase [Motilibacter rhizosphaerae]|uniref:Aldose 1-epimerase n=1 Tax=Motilibacter rhizosphaerae TaxID=598652 RepID=A0A4Q7NWG2_9ACTN|nr:aldose 1-epimerase family protein [Motilibacter rhizosphaerae]RZS91350.1 aldose 1-epimerase [Motilibacter rhizosphaerae]
MAPSGEQFRIESAGYVAEVTEVGGALRALSADGRPLVRGWSAERMMPMYGGALLAPWPNRIGDGAYSFRGVEAQAAMNEPAPRLTALHGLVAWLPWRAVEVEPDRLTLTVPLWPSPAYPWHLECTVTYAVGPDGLTWTLAARNEGDSAAPYGASVHPYFVAAPSGQVDGWRFELPAASFLDVDEERLLPREVLPVEGTDFDFRTARTVGSTFVDHAFTDLEFDAEGRTSMRLLGPDGAGVQLGWDRSCPWVQVHTADRPEPEFDRTGLAVEPMTCPPDAFRTGTDVVVLEPGQEHAVTYRVAAVRP